MTIPAHLMPPRWPDIEDTASERPLPRKHRADKHHVRAVAKLMRENMGLPPHPFFNR